MASPYFFDAAKADAAVEFFPRFLCHVDGEWAGRPFKLAEWQAHHTRQIFGWRRRKDGTRRYRFVRGWVPRKNGKSAWGAGLGHLLTIGDGEPGAQVLCHALTTKQANVVYDMAARMVAFSPELTKLYEVTKTGMLCTAASNACYRPLSGDPYSQHGLNPHAAIGDEAHVWKNGKLHTFLMQGMGARRQPMDITISTAGEIKTYGHELYETCKQIENDPTLDPETYVFIYEAPPDADWRDPEVWAKANPNLGVSIKHSFLESEFKQAIQSPHRENDFKRYHLNIWVEQARRWLAMTHWPLNTAQPTNKSYWKELPELMRGRQAYGGIDLGSTGDLSALVWVYPPDDPSGRVTLVPRFWMPEDNVHERDHPRHPYQRWVNEGSMETTPGNVTDYEFIIEAVCRDAERYPVQKIGIDILFQAMQVAIKLNEFGVPVQSMRQGHLTFAAPTLELERLFNSGRLEHGNHPVLEWMFRNAVVIKDHVGNIRPDKAKAIDKIDGVVAAVMGLGCAIGRTAPDYTLNFL